MAQLEALDFEGRKARLPDIAEAVPSTLRACTPGEHFPTKLLKQSLGQLPVSDGFRKSRL